MAENSSGDDKPSDWFINTAAAPRVVGTVAALVLTALAMGIAWLQANHPLWGFGPGDPVFLTVAGLIVCVGLGLLANVWWQSDAAWRRVPDGPLSPQFRALADSGRERDAIDRLRQEHGAGLSEARQVLDKYREHNSHNSQTSTFERVM